MSKRQFLGLSVHQSLDSSKSRMEIADGISKLLSLNATSHITVQNHWVIQKDFLYT